MRVDPLYSLGLSGSLDSLTQNENTLTEQLSSGLAVSSPSDNPLAASGAIALSGQISQDDAYTQAASGIESQMNVANAALSSAVTQITKAISLAVEGLGGTLDSSDITSTSQQLASIRDEIVSLANTSYAGSYVFAGTASNTQPFSVDTSTSPATTTYSGDNNSQYTETPGGQKIATSVPGSAIFTASGASIIDTLNNLVADFASGTPSSSASADLATLKDGLTNLSTQQSTLGNSLSVIESTSTYASTNEAALTAAQTSMVSTDTSKVATELSSNETQQQALLDVISSAGKYNLFSYMNQ